MSIPTLIFLFAIIAVLPAAIRVTGRPFVRNATAFAMVATWLFSRLIWALTGEWLPVSAMLIQDMVVIGAMFVKEDWIECPYRNGWHQLACLWLERTPWDRAILALYVPTWLFYAPIVEPHLQFWVLWSLSLAQLMLAGLEAAHPWLERMANKLRAVTAERPPPGSEMFTAWRLAGYE